MSITVNNMDDLRKVYLHDALFAGFEYDYKTRQIQMVCENRFAGKVHNLVFDNVISCKMQSCEFYSDDNTIMGHSVEKISHILDDLNAQKGEIPYLHRNSQLGKGIKFIVVEFELISGDTLEIICESVDHTETELKK